MLSRALATVPEERSRTFAGLAGVSSLPGTPAGTAGTAQGYLPLALEQAAAYIQYTAIEPAAYLDRLRRFPARMFAVSAPAEEADESTNQRTVARIWQLTVQAIEDEEPLAGKSSALLRGSARTRFPVTWLTPCTMTPSRLTMP